MKAARLPRKVATAPVVVAAKPAVVDAPEQDVVAPEPSESVQAVAPSVPQVDPRIRTLKKKLAQIAALEEKVQEGLQLSEEQVENSKGRQKLRKSWLNLRLRKLLWTSRLCLRPQPPRAARSVRRRRRSRSRGLIRSNRSLNHWQRTA